MPKFKSVKVQKIRFGNLAKFSEEEPDLDLIDIINDAVRERPRHNFIDAPGAFLYEIDLSVDIRRVIELGIVGFRVDFFRKSPRTKFKPKKGRRARNAMKYRGDLRNFLRRKKPKSVFTARINLNIPLPLRNFKFVHPPPLPKFKTHRVLINKPPPIRGKLFAAKISARPLRNVKKISGLGKSFTTALRNSLIKHKVDPAQALMRPSPVFPTFAAKMSRASVPLIKLPTLDPSDRISLNNIRIRRSLEEDREAAANQFDDDSNHAQELESLATDNEGTTESQSNTLGYVVNVQNRYQRIRRQIEIPKHSLGIRKHFYVRIIPILEKSKGWSRIQRVTEPFVFIVSHKRKVHEILLPEIPPQMTLVKNSRGGIVLRLKQLDPGSTKIAVARRIVSIKKSAMSPWKTVRVLKIEAEEDSSILVDSKVENVHPNQVLYRAVTLDQLGSLGPSSSLLVEGIQKIAIPALEDPNELSIVAKNEHEGIRIEVERIPESVISFRLLREDINALGELASRTISIPNLENVTNIDVVGDVKKYYFMDSSTSSQRQYRYFAAMRESLGGEFISEQDEGIIRIYPTNPLPVEVSIENTTLTEDVKYGRFTINIETVSLPAANGIDAMFSLLKNSGLDEVFLSQLEEQRSLFADLAMFIVERVDRMTGRRVSFGQWPAGKFSDAPFTRKIRKIPELNPGSRYTYFFKLCLRPPQSLMKSVFAKFSTVKTPGLDDKKVLAQKFMNGFSATFGVMPSDTQLAEGIPVAENFRSGETGLILEVDVTTPEARSLPEKLRVRIKNKGKYKHSALLIWEVTGGDLDKVDHCLIFVDYGSRKICIGTVSATGRGQRFWFFDKIYAPQVGTKTYTIRCVYSDLKVSPECRGIRIWRRSTTPKALLTGKFSGVTPRVKR